MNTAAPSRSLFVATSFAVVTTGCTPEQPDAGTEPAEDTGPLPCASAADCDDGIECCAGECVETDTDPDHCGACGVDCSDDDGFCSSQQSCSALSWSSLCDNADVVGLRDGNPPDNATTDLLLGEIASRCSVAPRTAGADDRAVIAEGGRPLLTSGTTLVAGGGGYFQPVVSYVEDQGVTGVYFDQVDFGNTSRIVRRDSGQVLASVPSTTTGDDEDWFAVYLVEVPESGALLFAAFGFVENGTSAAGLWAATHVLDDPGSYGDTWYVLRWSDTDALDGPTATDSFELVASGR